MNPRRIGTKTLRILLVSTFVFSLALLALFYSDKSSAQKAGGTTAPQEEHPRKQSPARDRSEQLYGPFDFERFKEREKAGEFPSQAGDVQVVSPYNSLTNNNGGATGTSLFTQSETTLVAFGNTVVVGFNDSGSNAGGTNKFTGFARSTDGGATFTDGGVLPTNPIGDAGDPVLARNETTGRIYFATLGFNTPGNIQVFRSDDNALTWQLPVNGTPGGSSEDKQWMEVDNYPGAGNGNVYLVSRNFGSGAGIFFYRSLDHGATFGPTNGVNIVSGQQGAFVTVGPDHSVYVFWYNGATIMMRKSTDQGVSFGAPVTVASGLTGGTNGDLGLTGQRQGTATFSGFRSSEFPHAVVNPVSGNVYVTFANNPAGTDKADIFLVQSTDGGATFGAPVRVNDDATTTDQWMPTLAVTPDGSTLGIFYYSRQEDPATNNLFKFYGRNAQLSGATISFTPSYAVSDVASLPEFGRDSLINSVYMGDYDRAVATPGAFHVTWSDNRDDLPGGAGRKDPNVYYKKIPLTISVSTTIPAVGSILNTQPVDFVVNVTEAVDPATVQATDFTVNGIPANSFILGAGNTQITFHFNSSPVTAQGLQTMAIAAGAFTSLAGGDPVAAFTGTFRYDVVTLQVTTTVPAVGGVFTLPSPFVYDVNFNEPVDPASVQAGDLNLSGIAGSSVSSATVLPGGTTARFTINIPSEGPITATIAAGQITDQFGNPNAAFSGGYVADIGTAQYPVPLLGKGPVGSLIYDPSAAGNIGFAGDEDSFTLNVDPGQTITAVVTGAASLQPSVTLRDPASNVIVSGTGAASGQPALLQTVPAANGGIYTFTLAGAAGTTGNYTLQVILNSATETEGLLGGNNNSIASAENINPSFINLQTSIASASRGAVSGTADGASYIAAAVPFNFEDISSTGTVIAGLTNQDDTSVSIPIGFNFSLYGTTYTSVFVSSNGLLTFGASNTAFTNSDLTTAPPQAAIAAYWDDQHTAGGLAGSNVLFQVSAPGPNQHLTIQWNQIRYFSGGTTGDTITYQAQLFADGRVQVNYQDLVSGTAGGNNGGSATLGIKDAGNQGANRLLLAFNNGPNAFVGTGQSTLISRPPAAGDFYSFTLGAGDVATLGVKNLGMTPVAVDLLDSGGILVATGVSGATNLDQSINNYSAAAPGTYYARVTASASVPYNLVVTRNAAFDTENNNSFATAQSLGTNRGALGALVSSGTYQATALPFNFEDISASGTEISGLTGADDAAVTIPIGFSFPFYGVNNANVAVSSNGLLTFGGTDTSFTNADLTTSPNLASIATFWDDQLIQNGGTVRFLVSGSGNNQHLTIQWNAVQFFSGGTAGDNITYQVQLFADGRIQVNYQDLVSGSAGGNNGASATLGIKAAGAQGPSRLLLAFNNGPNEFIGTGKSTLIAPVPGDDWYTVNAGAGQPLNFETSTPADGPGEFVNLLDPHIELYDPSGVLVASGTTLDGRNERIIFTTGAGGDYRVRITSEGNTTGEYFLGKSSTPPPPASVAAAGSTIVQEACSPNGQIDPGSRDGVNLQITNVTGSPLTNVVGTLLPGGGVILPTGPVNYGTIPAGGTVGRMFTFTADPSVPPGGTITANLHLQSGSTYLGNVIYTFIAGPAPCGGVRLTASATFTRLNPTTVQAVITVQNGGTLQANNVMLTTGRLGVVNGTPLPQSLGNLLPGASATATVTFANSTGGPTNLTVGATYTGGSLSSTKRYTIP